MKKGLLTLGEFYMDIQDVYLTLRHKRLCRNGHDFSVRYLGKTRNYMSSIQARNREPSVTALMTLYFKLNEQAGLLHDDDNELLSNTCCELLTMSGEIMLDVKQKCQNNIWNY